VGTNNPHVTGGHSRKCFAEVILRKCLRKCLAEVFAEVFRGSALRQCLMCVPTFNLGFSVQVEARA